jgi:hypothetical protein
MGRKRVRTQAHPMVIIVSFKPMVIIPWIFGKSANGIDKNPPPV